MGRQRTTFHCGYTLEVGNASEFLTYGPETAEVYPVAVRMLQSAREMFRTVTIPIVRTARQKYPNQEWWLIDSELKREYDKCWENYRAWKREAYRLVWQAAWNDTSKFWDAAEAGDPWPFLPAETPKVAHCEGTDFDYRNGEPIPWGIGIIVTSQTKVNAA